MKPFPIMQKNRISTLFKHILQIAHFGMVGIAATCVDLIVYHVAVGWGVGTPISKSISFVFGLSVSYLGNANITFRQRNRKPVRFLITYTCSLILNVSANEIGLNYIFHGQSHALTISWLAATGISALFNFLLLKKWVFDR